MSVFNADDTLENPLETLVGEGKKFKTVEDLARGKIESDNYIENLKRELADEKLANEANRRVEELLAQRQQKPQEEQGNNQPPVEPAPQVKPEDLAELVRKITAEDNKQAQIAANVNVVSAELVKIYGSEDNANREVKKRAAELGVTVEWLQGVAAQSPKAFFTTLGVQNTEKPAAPTRGDVNPQAFQSGNTQDNKYSWYREQMRADPKLRDNRNFQLKMHEAALKHGDDFFN